MMLNVNIPCSEHLGVEVHISLRQLADWSSDVDLPISLEPSRESEDIRTPCRISRICTWARVPSWLKYVGIYFSLYPVSIMNPPTKTFKTIQKASAKPQFPISFPYVLEVNLPLVETDSTRKHTYDKWSVAGYSLCSEHPDFTVLPASSWEDLNKIKTGRFMIFM